MLDKNKRSDRCEHCSYRCVHEATLKPRLRSSSAASQAGLRAVVIGVSDLQTSARDCQARTCTVWAPDAPAPLGKDMATLLFVWRTSWWDCLPGRWRESGWRWSSSVWRGSGCKWPLSVLAVPSTACTPSGHPERLRHPWLPLSRRPVRLSLRRLRCLHSGWADLQRIEPFWKRTDPTGKIQCDVSGKRGETHHNKHISSKPECATLCN